MSSRVKNKVGLITGAAQGLGKEMARLLIEEGAQVVMTDINEELLKKSADELNAPYYILDVTKPEDWQSILGNVEKEFSKLNILINNAGIGGGGDGVGASGGRSGTERIVQFSIKVEASLFLFFFHTRSWIFINHSTNSLRSRCF